LAQPRYSVVKVHSSAQSTNCAYNGNISLMVVKIDNLNDPMVYNYRYDQLDLIPQLDFDSVFNQTTNTWNTTSRSIHDFKERVAYDPNGDITK
jgi:hypothetical protein